MRHERNRIWWYNLSEEWQQELASNLSSSPDYLSRRMSNQKMIQLIEVSDDVLNNLVLLENIYIPKEFADDLSPLNYLKNIEEFRIQEQSSCTDFITEELNVYPKHLRSKVKRLHFNNIDLDSDSDMNVFKEFKSLEHLTCWKCNLHSLEGVQALTRLKRLHLPFGNFSDITPLQNVPTMEDLNLSGTKVTDLSPLINLKHLHSIGLQAIVLSDYQVLLKIPKLEYVYMNSFMQQIVADDDYDTQVRTFCNTPIDAPYALSEERLWWNQLSKEWQADLVFNLLKQNDYEHPDFKGAHPMHVMEQSNEHLSAIVNMEILHIPLHLVKDLEPVYYLKNIQDFYIHPPCYEEENAEEILDMYPKHLRSKVKQISMDAIRLSEDFTVFSDFYNLETLEIQSCHFETLEGIQKLTKLKTLMGGMNNHFSDLSPLVGLELEFLDLEWTQVSDLSPLEQIPSLVWVNLNRLPKVKDYAVLLKLPNLERVIFDGWEEVNKDDLAEYIQNNFPLIEDEEPDESSNEDTDTTNPELPF